MLSGDDLAGSGREDYSHYFSIIASLSSLVLPLTKNKPRSGRTTRLLATAVFPLDVTPDELP